MTVTIYKDLDVYKRAYREMIKIYKITKELPHYIQYDIGQDMRRAARSIPSNLCEGYSRRKSKKDTANFVSTSLGSCQEVIFNLEVLKDLDLLLISDYLSLHEEFTIVGKQLNKLLQSLRQ